MYARSGFPSIDQKLGRPLRSGQICMIAGRPSMGCTTFAINSAMRNALDGIRCLYVGIGMSHRELQERLWVAFSRDSGDGGLSWSDDSSDEEAMIAASDSLASLPLALLALPNHVSLDRLLCELWSTAIDSRAAAVYVDSSFTVGGGTGFFGSSITTGAKTVMRSLHWFAGESQTAVFALARLSRGLELRSDRRPRRSDIRGGSQIPSLASALVLLDRPRLREGQLQHRADPMDVVVARGGGRGLAPVRLAFIRDELRIIDPEDWPVCCDDARLIEAVRSEADTDSCEE